MTTIAMKARISAYWPGPALLRPGGRLPQSIDESCHVVVTSFPLETRTRTGEKGSGGRSGARRPSSCPTWGRDWIRACSKHMTRRSCPRYPGVRAARWCSGWVGWAWLGGPDAQLHRGPVVADLEADAHHPGAVGQVHEEVRRQGVRTRTCRRSCPVLLDHRAQRRWQVRDVELKAGRPRLARGASPPGS